MKTDSNTIIKLYNSDELAKFLNVSKVTVYRLIETRKIPFYKIKGSIRFAEPDVLKYLEQNRIESAD